MRASKIQHPKSKIGRLIFVFLFGLCVSPAMAQEGGQNYALLIGGLGGSPEYTEQFQQYLFETRRALIDRFQFPEANVVVLAETEISDQAFVTDVSTADNIRAQFSDLAATLTPEDHVFIVLFGHGSFDGEHARLNIPRRDLSSADFAELVDRLSAGRIVLINTASSSAPFIEAISAPDRIVITATKSGTQSNQTVFPQFLVEALTDPVADMDKTGDLSVRELFVYASEHTAQWYEADGHLATEHAMLEDTGDRQAARVDELASSDDGHLAAVTYLRPRAAAIAAADGSGATAQQLREQERLERQIAEVKSQKNDLSEDQYYAKLETLFVQLARLNEQIEATQD